MYLRGDVFKWGKRCKRNGFPIQGYVLDLGYWRKHPNLHGFIVKEFAGGVDKCQKIPLTAEQLETIILAVKANKLPHTTGFFFGTSDVDDDQRNEDVKILSGALAWLEGKPNLNPLGEAMELGAGIQAHVIKTDVMDQLEESREVYYQASW